MVKAHKCYWEETWETPLEKTSEEGQQVLLGMVAEALVLGSSQPLLALWPPLARDAVVQNKASALDAQSSPCNPCLSQYLYLME